MRIIIDWILKIVFPNLLQNPHLSFVILNTNNEFNISGSLKNRHCKPCNAKRGNLPKYPSLRAVKQRGNLLTTKNKLNISGSLKEKPSLQVLQCQAWQSLKIPVIASRETAWQSPNHKKQT